MLCPLSLQWAAECSLSCSCACQQPYKGGTRDFGISCLTESGCVCSENRVGEQCESCRSGFSDLSGQGVCEEQPLKCGAGARKNSETGDCDPCPPGTFKADDESSLLCEPCSLGLYQPGEGAAACVACPVGTYQFATGAVNCTACEDPLACPTSGQSRPYPPEVAQAIAGAVGDGESGAARGRRPTVTNPVTAEAQDVNQVAISYAITAISLVVVLIVVYAVTVTRKPFASGYEKIDVLFNTRIRHIAVNKDLSVTQQREARRGLLLLVTGALVAVLTAFLINEYVFTRVGCVVGGAIFF